MNTEIVKLNLDEIDDSYIHRNDMGDIRSLGESIIKVGLLQLLGVNEKNQLLWGKRRLAALRHLNWQNCEFHLVTSVTPLDRIEIEKAENEQRKDYTPSEMVAIAKSLEEAIGNRQGRRTDLPESQLSADLNEVTGRTSKHAANEAGFGSESTYRQAKTVVESGSESLIEQMDSGEKSIHAAYQQTRPKDKMVELELDLSNDKATTLDMLEAAIHRCCKSCDEPAKVLRHYRGLVA